MMTTTPDTPDLWGELPQADSRKSPTQIVNEQLSLLRTKTGGKLSGTVEESGAGQRFLTITAPSLGYSTHVLTFYHTPIDPYPVHIDVDRQSKIELSNEEEFMKYLAEFFQSARIKKIISNLLRETSWQSSNMTKSR